MKKQAGVMTDQRHFVMVYNDFLESGKLETCYQKLIFIYLKKFANGRGQCFPSVAKLAKMTGISENKVRLTIAELVEKGVIRKQSRTRPDGGKSSNLYTLYDFRSTWVDGTSANISREAISEDERMIEYLEKKGYTVQRNDCKKNVCDISKVANFEEYTIEDIYDMYDYNVMLIDHPELKAEIDAVCSILYDTLNSSCRTIRVLGTEKLTKTVKEKILQLSAEVIIYAIESYMDKAQQAKNPMRYMLSVLYNANDSYALHLAEVYSNSELRS